MVTKNLTRDDMVIAMLSSDKNFDGLFYTCVKTTTIYCNPSCRGKKPKPENVIFCYTIEDAQTNGFRACKRCKP